MCEVDVQTEEERVADGRTELLEEGSRLGALYRTGAEEIGRLPDPVLPRREESRKEPVPTASPSPQRVAGGGALPSSSTSPLSLPSRDSLPPPPNRVAVAAGGAWLSSPSNYSSANDISNGDPFAGPASFPEGEIPNCAVEVMRGRRCEEEGARKKMRGRRMREG